MSQEREYSVTPPKGTPERPATDIQRYRERGQLVDAALLVAVGELLGYPLTHADRLRWVSFDGNEHNAIFATARKTTLMKMKWEASTGEMEDIGDTTIDINSTVVAYAQRALSLAINAHQTPLALRMNVDRGAAKLGILAMAQRVAFDEELENARVEEKARLINSAIWDIVREVSGIGGEQSAFLIYKTRWENRSAFEKYDILQGIRTNIHETWIPEFLPHDGNNLLIEEKNKNIFWLDLESLAFNQFRKYPEMLYSAPGSPASSGSRGNASDRYLPPGIDSMEMD